MRQALAALLILFAALASRAEEARPTLSGKWVGTWADSRPAYRGSGGNFSGVAEEKEPGVWRGVFSISKSRAFTVELKGRVENGKLVFSGAVDLGDFQGVYIWKGVVAGDEFSGEYDGPDEKGTFKMTRARD